MGSKQITLACVWINSKPKEMKTQIIETFIRLKLEENKAVNNVYLFAKEMGMEEKEFYNHFASLEAVEANIFHNWFELVQQEVSKADIWDSYSAREKFLSFFFAWIEKLKENRSFVNMLWKVSQPIPKPPAFMDSTKEAFINFAKDVLDQGIQSKEIEDRKYLSNKYADAMWLNLLFVTNFWIKDNSDAFEKTDAAIEKSVNLAFDLMSKSALDSMLDLGKFLFQNR